MYCAQAIATVHNRYEQLATFYNRYEQLSKDPNSLANLDQDLPNYAQHMVPIHSLPQEWLWCETWCDDESKPKAKTIDLCNNPETKTPKLVRARRSRNMACHVVATWRATSSHQQWLSLRQTR